MDETLADVPITIIDCNEEFVDNPQRHKEMMATVSFTMLCCKRQMSEDDKYGPKIV